MCLRPFLLLLIAALSGCASTGSRDTAALPIPAAQRLVVDLDEDGGQDEVLLEINPRMGAFTVHVRHEGEDIYPFNGDWLPGDRAGLEWRAGDLVSDVRCQGWRPGTTCGHALGTHMPMVAIVVHHSRLGEYVLTPTRSYAHLRGTAPPPLRFSVSKAYAPTTLLDRYGS